MTIFVNYFFLDYNKSNGLTNCFTKLVIPAMLEFFFGWSKKQKKKDYLNKIS